MVGMLLGKQNPRLQLSGCANARRLDTGIVALSGKFPLDAAARRDTPAAVFKGPTLVMGRGGCFLFASALEYSPDALRTYDRDEYVMWGFGVHSFGRVEYEIRDGEVVYMDAGPVRVMVTEQHVGSTTEPTLRDLSEALIAVCGSDYGIHSLTWISRFTDMTRQAASYRKGRVLLARRRTRASPGRRTGPPDRGAGCGESGMEAGPGGQGDVAGKPPGHLPRRAPPLLGRRMPDLDLVTANGPLRVFTLLHDARPVLLNLGGLGGFDITPWADRVQLIDANYDGVWELPALGAITAPTAVLIRPDGHVAWVGAGTHVGLRDAVTTWFGPPAAA
jgi:hypothetical protein